MENINNKTETSRNEETLSSFPPFIEVEKSNNALPATSLLEKTRLMKLLHAELEHQKKNFLM